MDIWQTACYFTVFWSVFEYCFVIYLTQIAAWEEEVTKKKKVDVKDKKGSNTVKKHTHKKFQQTSKLTVKSMIRVDFLFFSF